MWSDLSTQGPYSALLRVGLAVPVLLPVLRWALTPPFHPYPAGGAVSFLWRFPWGCPRRALPGTLPSWSPDFPRAIRPAVIQPSAQGGRYGEWGRASSPKAVGVGGGGLASGAPRPGLRGLRREYLGQDEIGSVSADQAWPNSCARCWAKARSVASSGPVAQGRKRRRKAARRISAGALG